MKKRKYVFKYDTVYYGELTGKEISGKLEFKSTGGSYLYVTKDEVKEEK